MKKYIASALVTISLFGLASCWQETEDNKSFPTVTQKEIFVPTHLKELKGESYDILTSTNIWPLTSTIEILYDKILEKAKEEKFVNNEDTIEYKKFENIISVLEQQLLKDQKDFWYSYVVNLKKDGVKELMNLAMSWQINERTFMSDPMSILNTLFSVSWTMSHGNEKIIGLIDWEVKNIIAFEKWKNVVSEEEVKTYAESMALELTNDNFVEKTKKLLGLVVNYEYNNKSEESIELEKKLLSKLQINDNLISYNNVWEKNIISWDDFIKISKELKINPETYIGLYSLNFQSLLEIARENSPINLTTQWLTSLPQIGMFLWGDTWTMEKIRTWLDALFAIKKINILLEKDNTKVSFKILSTFQDEFDSSKIKALANDYLDLKDSMVKEYKNELTSMIDQQSEIDNESKEFFKSVISTIDTNVEIDTNLMYYFSFDIKDEQKFIDNFFDTIKDSM